MHGVHVPHEAAGERGQFFALSQTIDETFRNPRESDLSSTNAPVRMHRDQFYLPRARLQ
jgi:hypothetical protein